VGTPETTPQQPQGGQPAVEVIGPAPFQCGPDGQNASRIGTIFPFHRALVTLPGIHATQRMDFIERCNEKRRAAGEPALPEAEEERLLLEAVDLIFEADHILIRPDPSQMELAFAADDLLDEMQLVSRRNIRFLFVMDPKVHDAIQARGQNWRISPLPQSAADMCRLIEASRVAIRECPIYYFNRFTGTRHLTCQEFAGLGRLDDPGLARQLQEVALYSAQRNRRGSPEVAFFPPGTRGFGPEDLRGTDFAGLPPAALRERFGELRRRFEGAVEPDFRQDDARAEHWRNRMLSALVSQKDQTITVDLLRQLSPEFFMQVEWLPGGRFDQGEFMFDSVFEEAERSPQDEGLRTLCDPLVREFIFSYIREYGTLEYINIGRIRRSLSNVRPLVSGRRGVYLVQLKVAGVPVPILRLIRLQKWGIGEHLDEGKPLLQALLENDDYTDYVLDRGLGARQLGMNLPARLRVLRTREKYAGTNPEVRGLTLPVVCFERGYLGGLATDKVPPSRYQKEGYPIVLAALLGRAAAPNIIVGRIMEHGGQTIFDDGDEIVMEDPMTGLPSELIVGDPSGAFADYQRDLVALAKDYARPVNLRAGKVPQLRAFAEAYLRAFEERFVQIQGDYRRRRRAFDHLFKHCRYDIAGSFARRWECVLRRLDETDAGALTLAIRGQIGVLQPHDPAPPGPA
jgi:hypothetical protein